MIELIKIMYIYQNNQPIFSFPETHPARRFLEAFVKCREQCVGKELSWPNRGVVGVDQKWQSTLDEKEWLFSEFAYKYLSFDIILDGWLDNAPQLTLSEKEFYAVLPRLHALLDECEQACVCNKNEQVLAMIQQVREVLRLWHECIEYRLNNYSDVCPDPT